MEDSALENARPESLREALEQRIRCETGTSTLRTMTNGDCFFNALHILRPTVFKSVSCARQLVVKHLRAHWGRLSTIDHIGLDGSCDTHCSRMLAECAHTYAEQPEIEAVADILGGLQTIEPAMQQGEPPLATVGWADERDKLQPLANGGGLLGTHGQVEACN